MFPMKRKIFFILIFILTFPLYFFSQNVTELEMKLGLVSGLEKIKLLDQLSEIYLEKDLAKSINYAELAIKLSEKTKIPDKLKSDIYNTLGAAYYYSGDYDKSVKYYEDELASSMKSSSKVEIAKAYYNIALIYNKSNRNKKAENNFEKSIEIAKKIKHNTLLAYNYRALAALKEQIGNNAKAYEYLKQYIKIRDLSFSTTQNILRKEIKEEKILREETEKTVKVLEQDTLKKAQEIEYLNIEKEIAEKIAQQEREINESKQQLQQAQIERQKIMSYIMIGIIVFVVLIGLIILRSYLQKKKTNRMLVNKNFEIQQQKEEIETQNGLLQQQKEEIIAQNEELEFQKLKMVETHQHITDSINYASRIQTAMLHGESILGSAFNQYFIIYKPRDIVSGDFYWVRQIRNYIVIVAADCTGHGVPGAFMSMLGISLLNEYVTSRRLDSPGEILDTLRKKVKIYLKQTGEFEETKDGMDMALCLINTENLKAKYSGANNPLFLIRKGELVEYKATRNPIGIYLKEKNFETQEFQLEKGDSLYLFSDGFIDQFGGEKGGKLKSKKFKEILILNFEKPMEEQKQILDDTITQWQGEYEQVDDMLIMGIKI